MWLHRELNKNTLKETHGFSPSKTKNSTTKENAIITVSLYLTVKKRHCLLLSILRVQYHIIDIIPLSTRRKNLACCSESKYISFCLYLLFSMKPYFFKIDDHISMLFSLLFGDSMEGLDLLIELSNLWPTMVKSAHACSTTNFRAQISETRLQQ
jgi:hypothetical protein